MGIVDIGDLFHTGVVVRDFERSLHEYQEVYGITWGFGGESEVPVRFPDGAIKPVTFRFAYSEQGPHRIELVRAIDGTLWQPAGPGQAHHLGLWSDDVPTASKRLAALGWPLVAEINVAPDTPVSIVYHQSPDGHFIELIDRASKAYMFPND